MTEAVEEVGTAQDETVQQAVRDTRKERERQDKEAVSFVMSDPRGQRFIAWLIDQTGFMRVTNSDNALTSARREGKRVIGADLMGVAMKHDPRCWRAIEDFYHARIIEPTNKPKGQTNE